MGKHFTHLIFYNNKHIMFIQVSYMNSTFRLVPLTAVVATLLSLTACQTIPKAKTEPVVAQPHIAINQPYETYDSQTVSGTNQPSIASQRWQDFYSDAKLKQLIQLGLDNNKDISATILAIQKARAQYQIQDIADVPTINSSANVNRAGDFKGNAANTYNVGLAMSSYEFDFWGRIASLKDAALQNYLATTAAKDAAQISLISNIAQNYVAYSYSLAQLQLAKQTLATRQDSLRINQLRFKAGLDSQLTSVQAQAAVEAAKVSIAQAQTNLLTNQNALRYLVGAPVDNSLLPAAGISSITNNRIFGTGLPSDLLLYRPDLRQAEYNLKAAGANINAARAAFYPTISLSGNVGAASSSLGDLFKTGAFSWGFGPSVSLPIFDAGLRKANYQVSEIEQQQALNTYEKAIQTAFKEVNDVFANRATLNQQLAAYNQSLAANQKYYQIVQARFKAGLDNYLGVLDAQRSIYSSQQSILNTKQSQLLSQIQLYQVLGGGVSRDVPLETPTEKHTNFSTKLSQVANNVQQKITDATHQPSQVSTNTTSTTTTTTTVQP
ncbi:adeC/adeK/oprM family multidrug efflux complex outer membrane factor [Streptomyces cinereus]|nr:adeC/adeK/oprM family multidrug efflux complex outer membrane factor [Streptomyces cinereus]